ncbi:hypothetical protein GCM10007962_12000 [Yeosuana aromativorans]|uniref:Uncharacterized protein n=1 Tax=Yeosuana aromativorans TaxID=288019 RepID=A0A8J3BMB0_9FLAO|nr:hypothetical protein GCM10007962_12000 [Yeosuana aromativorans]
MFHRLHPIQQAEHHQLEEVTVIRLQTIALTRLEEVLLLVRQVTIQAGAVLAVQAIPDHPQVAVALEVDQVPVHQAEEGAKTTYKESKKRKEKAYEKVKLIIDRSVIYTLYLRSGYYGCT